MGPRATAVAKGEKRYWPGHACKNGHVCERYTKSAHCVECQRRRNLTLGPIWRARNPDRVREHARDFTARNPGYSVSSRRKRGASYYASVRADPNRRLGRDIRASISSAIRRGSGKKSTATATLLGCSIAEFKGRIERLWLDGMSWENWGLGRGCWHLDHKRPISSFDLTDPAQQRECFNFRNYQPLWSEDNIRKGARWQQ